jgi:hypothetical protein
MKSNSGLIAGLTLLAGLLIAGLSTVRARFPRLPTP